MYLFSSCDTWKHLVLFEYISGLKNPFHWFVILSVRPVKDHKITSNCLIHTFIYQMLTRKVSAIFWVSIWPSLSLLSMVNWNISILKCFHLGFYHLKIKQKHLQRRDIFLAQWFSLNEKIFLTRTCGKMSQYCEDDHNNIVTILLQYHHNIITVASQYCHKTVRMTTTSAKRREIEAFWRFAAFLDKDISNTVDFSKIKNIWRMMRSIWLGRSQTQRKQR